MAKLKTDPTTDAEQDAITKYLSGATGGKMATGASDLAKQICRLDPGLDEQRVTVLIREGFRKKQILKRHNGSNSFTYRLAPQPA